MALQEGRGSASLYANRGWAYLQSGAPASALRDFDRALRMDASNAHALSGRALANVQQRRPREAVADARESLRVRPGDHRQFYNAARILCQAAVCLEADAAHFPGAWNEAGGYRAESIEYLARAANLAPEADREKFWDEVVRTDPALEPVRKARQFVELDVRFARTAFVHSHEKVSRHDVAFP